ncbi:phosphoglycolate phosphatase [Faunimonas pinastri]|uniref:phosphoglycolate phosphatase n=1 Tax=Faunimonas pinastri TaxID=1855383 RepID=A0A1H9PA41_9HYPH|nr:HAD hydrolase-like protein [Faunimonas pinastri]SER44699.1 phosphoglycolate phosphatase [Faunimonas pinastri]
MQPLLVFDLDGTLVDTAPDLLATLDFVLEKHGFGAPHDPGLRDGIGFGARHLIEIGLRHQGASVPPEKLDTMFDDFLAHYEKHMCEESRIFDGVLPMLDRFAQAGWRFAICTNKLEYLARELLDQMNLAPRFEAICGADTFGVRKPEADHLLRTIAAASGSPQTAIMVGDAPTDSGVARNAGVPFIGLTFGYTTIPMAELAPDLMLDHYDGLTVAEADRLLGR